MFKLEKFTKPSFIMSALNKISDQDKLYFKRAIFLAVVIRIALFIVAYFIGRAIPKYDTPFFNFLYQVFYKWDARAFLHLAEYGYTTVNVEQTYLAYFPLYPAAVAIFKLITPTYMTSALLVSFIASVFGGYFIQKLVSFDYDEKMTERSLWFFYFFPTAYFLVVPYTESLFVSLVLGSFVFTRQKKWGLACLLAALACATRLQGLVMIPVILIEFWLQRKDVKLKQVLWTLIIPSGFLVYLFINWYVHSDPFKFLQIQREFFYHNQITPWEQIRMTVSTIFTDKPSEYRTMLHEARLVAIIGTFILLGISVKWMRPSYQFYGWSQILVYLTDSWLMSLPRYTFAIFPLFITLSYISKKPQVFQSLLVISGIIMSGLFCLYVAGNWAF